jgi:hypothetical protein
MISGLQQVCHENFSNGQELSKDTLTEGSRVLENPGMVRQSPSHVKGFMEYT